MRTCGALALRFPGFPVTARAHGRLCQPASPHLSCRAGAPSPCARAASPNQYTPSEGVRGPERVSLNARSDRAIASCGSLNAQSDRAIASCGTVLNLSPPRPP
eukprot:2415740-Pleurochrysis_carterae.AAC.1